MTTAKTTDVEGRLSALLQETKELKVSFGKTAVYYTKYEINFGKSDCFISSLNPLGF